jgi:hypothetical protein
MFERALNAFWILLGAAAAAYAWTLGLIGASGPESGLFPFLAGLIIMGAGVVLLLRPLSENILQTSRVAMRCGALLASSPGLLSWRSAFRFWDLRLPVS